MRLTATQRRILVFAKAPIPGRVKTRLQSRISPSNATALHRSMVIETLSMACASRLAAVELWCTSEHAFFTGCKQRFPLVSHLQKGKNLGTRMHFALKQTLLHCKTAIIIGTDCPAMDAAYLETAFEELSGGSDIVLGPSEDGGYVLIGARRIDSALFCDIQWGGNNVLAQTRSALHVLGWSWSELDTLWDVDRPEDLDRLRLDERFSGLLENYIHDVQDT